MQGCKVILWRQGVHPREGPIESEKRQRRRALVAPQSLQDGRAHRLDARGHPWWLSQHVAASGVAGGLGGVLLQQQPVTDEFPRMPTDRFDVAAVVAVQLL